MRHMREAITGWLRHRFSHRLFVWFDWLFHYLFLPIVKFLWNYGLIGLIASTALYIFASTGHIDLSFLLGWQLTKDVINYDVIFTGIGILFLYGFVIAWYAHRYVIHPTTSMKSLEHHPLAKLNFAHDADWLNLGENSPQGYFERPLDIAVREKFHALAARSTGGGVILTGITGVGKTRLVLEAARREFPHAELLKWPFTLMAITDDVLNTFGAVRVVVLLDDLTTLAPTDRDARFLTQSIHHLRRIAHQVILLITYTDGIKSPETIQRRCGSLLAGLGRAIMLDPMEPESGEGKSFLLFARRQQQRDRWLRTELDHFDGTPGSVFAGLDERTRQIEHGMPTAAQVILKVLALLQMLTLLPTEQQVVTIATALFALTPDQWQVGLNWLRQRQWLMSQTRSHRDLRVRNGAYLTECLPEAGYDTEQQDADLARLIVAFSAQDTEALLLLSDVLAQHGRYEDALLALQKAQTTLRMGTKAWADAQQRFGVLYSETDEGSPLQNEEAALDAYHDALTVYSAEATPLEFATTQNNMGNLLLHRHQGDKDANVEQAIDAFKASLRIFTLQEYPEEFAQAQLHLGEGFETLATKRLRHRRRLLGEAITALGEASKAYTPETHPEQYVATQLKIGNIYQFQLRHEPAKAIQAYREALALLDPHYRLTERARTLINLGIAYSQFEQGNIREHIMQALQYCEAGLQLVTREQQLQLWTHGQNTLGNCYLRLHRVDETDNADAIACYQRALDATSRENNPENWAIYEHNLGVAYQHRHKGNRQDNLREAEACFDAALADYEEADAHYHWARCLYARGLLYLLIAREVGDVTECRRRQHAANRDFTNALDVYTVDAYPPEYQQLQDALEAAAKLGC